MIAQLVKNIPKDTDPGILAELVIAHIQRVLPQILKEISLPPTMSAEKLYIETAKLKGKGFRQPSGRARSIISGHLKQDNKVNALRNVKERIRNVSHTAGTAMSQFSTEERRADDAGGVQQNAYKVGDFTEIFLPISSAATSRPHGFPRDVSSTRVAPFRDPALKPPPVNAAKLGGLDVRGKFAIIRNGRLIELVDGRLSASRLPRGAQQIEIPNSPVYESLNSASLLGFYSRLDRKQLSYATEKKLIDAILEALELEEQWSLINKRRFHLITKRNRTGLRAEEADELDRLQTLARDRVNLIAPLPLSTLEILQEYARRTGVTWELSKLAIE